MAAPARTTGVLARSRQGLPLQPRPTTGKWTHPLVGPNYWARTRGSEMGLPNPAVENERPYMDWKDTWRSNVGLFSWDRDDMSSYQRKMNSILKIRTERGWYTGPEAPGSKKARANPAAVPGPRVLSQRWTPLELADGGLFYVHPTQREVLEWTQGQLKEDAKLNGTDVDKNVEEKIEEVLQHDPVQPYFYMKDQRNFMIAKVRRETIRQEMRIHRLRRERGLSTPPIIMPTFDEEYPDDPTGEPKTRVVRKWYQGGAWRVKQRFGSIQIRYPRDQLMRMRRRMAEYRAELAEKGVDMPVFDDHVTESSSRWAWDRARERALRQFGRHPAEAEIVQRGEDEPFVGEH
eukprot:TRINITY_DN60145_c0_g1_i1.p1 TRINITY_DN60145_c0_g1~~TRINITY_DN60145_c0_g1_i1.p1  ORF type:complete len:347 (+),score=91.06 TRINITY_DN60145_c0_g1_i1:125-1165(+)